MAADMCITSYCVVFLFIFHRLQVAAAFADGASIEYDVECGIAPNGTALIVVTTDLAMTEPYAICQQVNKDYLLVQKSEVRYELVAYYNESEANGGCVFVKKMDVESYSVDVYVPKSQGIFTFDMDQTSIQCNFEPHAEKDTDLSDVEDSRRPAEELRQHIDEPSKTTIRLYLTDVLDKEVTDSIRLGKPVRLIAEMMDYFPDEVSFQVTSCKAMGGDYHYPILVAGCGDGLVLAKNTGFTTKNRTAKSAFFQSFRLPGSRTVVFKCDFIICDEMCDGSSCETDSPEESRKRRSATQNLLPVNFGEDDDLIREEQIVHDDPESSVAIVEAPKTKAQRRNQVKDGSRNHQIHSTEDNISLLQTELIVAFALPVVLCFVIIIMVAILFRRLKRELVQCRCYSNALDISPYKTEGKLDLSFEYANNIMTPSTL